MTAMEKVYLDAQAACGLKVGDYVRVARKGRTCEAGWENFWNPRMDEYVGQVGVIIQHGVRDTRVKFADSIWWDLPYFVLEKVEKPQHEFKPFDRVLARDKDDQEWACAFFSHMHGARYVCNMLSWDQCIPYEGNERLLGTTEKPE